MLLHYQEMKQMNKITQLSVLADVSCPAPIMQMNKITWTSVGTDDEL
jgi:hypothetical protein